MLRHFPLSPTTNQPYYSKFHFLLFSSPPFISCVFVHTERREKKMDDERMSLVSIPLKPTKTITMYLISFTTFIPTYCSYMYLPLILSAPCLLLFYNYSTLFIKQPKIWRESSTTTIPPPPPPQLLPGNKAVLLYFHGQ